LLLAALLAGGCVSGAQAQRPDDGAVAGTPAAAQAGAAADELPPPGAVEPDGEIERIPLYQFERLDPSPPVKISIPRIGASSRLVELGLERDGTMEVPEDFDRAGWFTEGPQPGQVGPAVIAGHVDSKSGPAVFYRLRELRKGDQIMVERADGRTLRFVVERRDQFPKDSFPTEAIFGPVPWPALRLITCGGSFDHSKRSYRDNIIVSARLA
jgi:sortase family protein